MTESGDIDGLCTRLLLSVSVPTSPDYQISPPSSPVVDVSDHLPHSRNLHPSPESGSTRVRNPYPPESGIHPSPESGSTRVRNPGPPESGIHTSPESTRVRNPESGVRRLMYVHTHTPHPDTHTHTETREPHTRNLPHRHTHTHIPTSPSRASVQSCTRPRLHRCLVSMTRLGACTQDATDRIVG